MRALIIAEADLGERIVRALILRRVGLHRSGASGPVLIGPRGVARAAAIAEFPAAATVILIMWSTRTMTPRRRAVEQYGAAPSEVLAVCPNGTVLFNPSEEALARCLGCSIRATSTRSSSMLSWSAPDRPVSRPPFTRHRKACASSRSTAGRIGGQAGASARIENYLGFPTGISGQALAGRAFVQAQKFGAEIMIPAQAAALDCTRAGPGGELALTLDRWAQAQVANGSDRQRRALSPAGRAAPGRVRGSRRLVLGLGARGEDMRATTKWSWSAAATPPGRRRYSWPSIATKVHMLVRGRGLAASMSRYLIDRIEATPNIEMHPHTQLTNCTVTRRWDLPP